MKILTISNFYPPYHIGGYELGCRDVMRGLMAKGHQVEVLTSCYGLPGTAQVNTAAEQGVTRALPDWHLHERRRYHYGALRYWVEVLHWERTSLAAWRKVFHRWKPDVIYCWNLFGVSSSLLALAETSNCPVIFYVSDEWLIQWPKFDPRQEWLRRTFDAFPKRTMKVLLDTAFQVPGLRIAPRDPDLGYAQFTSHSLREKYTKAGIPAGAAEVIHWGIDADHFRPRPAASLPAKRLLYVGQVVSHKGPHTLIDAFLHLHQSGHYGDATLTVAGGTMSPDYHDKLVAAVKEAGLETKVQFLGPVAREKLSFIYREHDVLVFPSVWEEPFSITLLEALSSGLAVVATMTGGTPEVLIAEVNALVFPVGDAKACAAQLARLLDDPSLVSALAKAGRQTVLDRFQFSSMLDKIDHTLSKAIGIHRDRPFNKTDLSGSRYQSL